MGDSVAHSFSGIPPLQMLDAALKRDFPYFQWVFSGEHSSTSVEMRGSAVRLVLPTRASTPEEAFVHTLPTAKPFTSKHAWLWDDGESVCGLFLPRVTPATLETTAASVYSRIFSILGQRSLHRAWNFVPAINAVCPPHEEAYRLFCAGRALAFEKAFGGGGEGGMAAASAVGVRGDRLVVFFRGGCQPARSFENEAQTPAYRYPRDFGPKSPSFTRATVVTSADCAIGYISGTAAIRGSSSHFPGDLLRQLDLSVTNLCHVARQAGCFPANKASPSTAFLRTYVRNWTDAPAVEAYLCTRLPTLARTMTLCEAEICRRELLVEIEATFQLS